MSRFRCLHLRPRRLAAGLTLAVAAMVSLACGAIPFSERPAAGYVYGADVPLVVAVVDETEHAGWTAAIDAGEQSYEDATPHLRFQESTAGANIVITVRRYRDAEPPVLTGYRFQPGVAAFAAVYDADGEACNFPPSPLPVNCDGEIARADVYVNDALADGPDIDDRRRRLVLHEFGHAMGLTRHSADLRVDQLSARYGW